MDAPLQRRQTPVNPLSVDLVLLGFSFVCLRSVTKQKDWLWRDKEVDVASSFPFVVLGYPQVTHLL